jgi:hypothetical protein
MDRSVDEAFWHLTETGLQPAASYGDSTPVVRRARALALAS